jgi:hypothetical protein
MLERESVARLAEFFQSVLYQHLRSAMQQRAGRSAQGLGDRA